VDEGEGEGVWECGGVRVCVYVCVRGWVGGWVSCLLVPCVTPCSLIVYLFSFIGTHVSVEHVVSKET